MAVGTSRKRVDGPDKVTGRAKYVEDLLHRGALVAKVLHSTIAHGYVKSFDTAAAEKVVGVVRIFTCFDVPDYTFSTAGHPWTTDPAGQDVADRLLLNRHVRFYGDDIAVIVAESRLAAEQAAALIDVEYDELPALFDPRTAMEEGQPRLHEDFADNILGHSSIHMGDAAEAIKEPGLTKVEGWYETPMVQHCHMENAISYAYEESGQIVVVSSTQIPHIVRRICAQALGVPWGRLRIIKPYIGGGFGNKQDALYEPLNAWLAQQLGGRTVLLDISREENFYATRTRHAITFHICSWVRADGSFAARTFSCWSNQGAYASHGHGIAAKGMGAFPQLYPCDNIDAEAYTVYTNLPTAGAMRGYGIPQAMFAIESHTEDICMQMGLDSYEFRLKYTMPKGYVDSFSKNENYFDSFRECLEKGAEAIDYTAKREAYSEQDGEIRRGIGCAVFWYNTGVWPISLETSSCRMVLNQDGSVQLQVGETEIGQGADTAFAQMAADSLGIPMEDVHVVSVQDTNVTPYGSGAYASRQTYMAGSSIYQTARLLRDRILDYASGLFRLSPDQMDLEDGMIVRQSDGRRLMSLGELATEALYSLERSEHITAERTYQTKNNAYSFGCSFAEVEVDIPLCRIKLLNMVNVHDAGRLINPALAEAQVHGGMSMAIGYGLSESMMFDPKTGRMLNDNLLDYKLSTTMDHPDLTALFVENPEPTQIFGTKSLGEPPTCSGAPAIRNAVYQAVGIPLNEIPMTPHVLFRRFSEEGLI